MSSIYQYYDAGRKVNHIIHQRPNQKSFTDVYESFKDRFPELLILRDDIVFLGFSSCSDFFKREHLISEWKHSECHN